MEQQALMDSLCGYINASPTAFHAVLKLKEALEEKGFIELKLSEKWSLNKQGNYYVTYNDSACFAFRLNYQEETIPQFKIVTTHTDSPGFKLKPQVDIRENGYWKLNTEVYGGPILNTWVDRPLSIAGRVMTKGKTSLCPKVNFIDIKEPIAVIPNVAIHFNRKLNEGVELNKQKDLLPILGMDGEDQSIFKLLVKHLSLGEQEILSYDLFLYPEEKARIIGAQQEFIYGPRLDDLAMVHANLQAFLQVEDFNDILVLAAFDNEEVGSLTRQGANSPLLKNILERICISFDKTREEYYLSLEESIILSLDMAHGIHPNSPEKSDPTHKPKLNEGPVLKVNSNFRYATDGFTEAIMLELCNKANIPLQKFVYRSDIPGGSTLGPILATHLNIRCVDIGNSLLAMHSIGEIAGVKDHAYMVDLVKHFYQTQ
jgi:aspartyl aminopeptidase